MSEAKKVLTLETGRVPPQAIDLEQAVLGAIMLEHAQAMPVVMGTLSAEDFYKSAHRMIFQAMFELFNKGEPIDLLTLNEELRRRGEMEKVGGDYYLTELPMKVTTAANVEFHARVVKEKSLARKLIEETAELSQKGFDQTQDIFELLEEAEERIFRLSESRVKKNAVPLSVSIHDSISQLEAIHGHKTGVVGIGTGFVAIDSMTSGFQKGDLIIVAGRPSQGKTAFVLSLARNSSLAFGTKIQFFSMEMTMHQLVTRLIAGEARVNAHNLRSGRSSDADFRMITTKLPELSKLPIYIDDTPAQTAMDLRAKARRMKHEQGVDMVIVDYLQLMRAPGKAPSREQEIAEISRSLKALAKELNIPVVALSQLNRGVENRSDKRPVLSDLRESGAIEQDADVVLFVHRPETYGIEKVDGIDTPGMAEIVIAKQRNGPTGIPKLHFVKEYARFENWNPAKEPQLQSAQKEELPF